MSTSVQPAPEKYTSVQLDAERFNSPIRTKRKGITVEVSLSPYDVPASVTGAYCRKRKKFVIDFSYLGGAEKTNSRTVSEHLICFDGASSGRIYSIEVDVNTLQVDEVKLVLKQRLTEAIDAFKPLGEQSTRDELRSQMNVKVLGEVRDHYLNRLVPAELT